MNSWLITWECLEHRPKSYEKVAAILSSRRSTRTAAELIEWLYVRAIGDAKSMAFFANNSKKTPYRAECPQLINGVPHERILCGHNPWLYGRRVSELTVIHKHNVELISWKEPPTFRWKGESRRELEMATDGEIKKWRRQAERPLSEDVWRWRD